MAEDRICRESCYEYDPEAGGCRYQPWYVWDPSIHEAQKVKPGDRCLHPEVANDIVFVIPLIDLCNALAVYDTPEDITPTKQE